MDWLQALLENDAPRPFVAIDFETADQGPDSACAVALVRVEGGRIVERRSSLLRPPRRIRLGFVHGITWDDVADAPTFGECWPALSGILDGAQFLVAHNSSFDSAVLRGCCIRAALPMPEQPFLCSAQLARFAWKLRRAPLPTVCARLGIPLTHHDPRSDAEACARIVIEACLHLRNGGLPVSGRRCSSAVPSANRQAANG